MKRAAFLWVGVLLLTPLLQAQSPEDKKATLAFVAIQQNKDGGFSAIAGQPSSLRATNAAVRIYKYFGGEVPNKDACSKFVTSCFDKNSGGFADTPDGDPNVTATAVGLMAVVGLGISRDPYEKAALKYLDENAKTFDDIRIAVAGLEAIEKKSPQAKAWTAAVKKTANADGTYGKSAGIARDTGSAVVALLRMGVEVPNKDAVLKAMNAGQLSDGGFGQVDAKRSDLESCYRVVRCYHMLKSKPDAGKMAAFVASCRNADGGYGVVPGAKSTISATYYAAIISHWLAEK